jgi:hypothetical protein
MRSPGRSGALLDAVDGAGDEGSARLARHDLRNRGQKSGGLELTLPPDAIPTIAALVSRRLAECAGANGPYLVAEADSRRPLASIALPAGFEPRRRSAPRDRGRAKRKRTPAAPVHLAILYRQTGTGAVDATDARRIGGTADDHPPRRGRCRPHRSPGPPLAGKRRRPRSLGAVGWRRRDARGARPGARRGGLAASWNRRRACATWRAGRGTTCW